MTIKSIDELPSVKNYLRRINAEVRSLYKAVIKKEKGNGYWEDIAVIKFAKDGTVSTPAYEYMPSTDEQEEIKEAFAKAEFPKQEFIDLNDPNLPQFVKDAMPDNVFVFRDTQGNVTFLQVRQDLPESKKKYTPVTYFSDGEYRTMEPEGDLQLYGLENLKEASVVYLFEGAKTARNVQRLIEAKTEKDREERDSHPWKNIFMPGAVALGWTSGALTPHRVNYTPINKSGIDRCYVFLDNDEAGRSAMKTIAKSLRVPTFAVSVSDDFPSGFDLSDEFPPKFFKEIEGKKYYVGPSFRDCIAMATWMTDTFETEDKKKGVKLRHHVKTMFAWVEETNTFCWLEDPRVNVSADTLDSMLRPFSDIEKTSKLLLQEWNGRISSFDYVPATSKRRIISNGKQVINLYQPSNLIPRKGEIKPFMDFMEQLIPDADERHHMLRWIATLYAKPEIRMLWAPLLVSNETGTGKSTLARIASDLVGVHNTSFPTETALTEVFNSWLGCKRLAVINEIYAGASWKTFNKIKDLITEPRITMRALYKDGVDISNYCHFLLCSNTYAALKIDDNDRRIFMPTVTEQKWGDENWNAFHNWIESGGLSIIAQWAIDFGHYVGRAERAPYTSRKQEVIEASKSEAVTRAEEIALEILEMNVPVVLSVTDVMEYLKMTCKDRVFETALVIRKVFVAKGCIDAKDLGIERTSYKSRQTYFVMNPIAALEMERKAGLEERKTWLKMKAVNPSEIVAKEII